MKHAYKTYPAYNSATSQFCVFNLLHDWELKGHRRSHIKMGKLFSDVSFYLGLVSISHSPDFKVKLIREYKWAVEKKAKYGHQLKNITKHIK